MFGGKSVRLRVRKREGRERRKVMIRETEREGERIFSDKQKEKRGASKKYNKRVRDKKKKRRRKKESFCEIILGRRRRRRRHK